MAGLSMARDCRPSADVGIKDGKIAGIGRLHGTAARTIDADGLVVSPGFIDHHTHMDGQILWTRWHLRAATGETSIIMGTAVWRWRR